MISTIFFWLLFKFVQFVPSINFVSFPFLFCLEHGKYGRNRDFTHHIYPPPNSTRTAVKTCHSKSPRGGEGNNPKQIFVLPIYMFSTLVIRGLILSLGKGEGYRAHTLVVEILCIPQLFNYLV